MKHRAHNHEFKKSDSVGDHEINIEPYNKPMWKKGKVKQTAADILREREIAKIEIRKLNELLSGKPEGK